MLVQHELPPECVTFEITEQLAVRPTVDVDTQVAALRQMGCQLAIDDFGTGYSSFSYLKRLPVDFIKIDGTFVKDLANDAVDQTMVRLIGEIGRAAGIKIIAEYVQDSAALTLLSQFGIDYAQGFYIGRPASAPTRANMPIPFEPRRSSQKLKA